MKIIKVHNRDHFLDLINQGIVVADHDQPISIIPGVMLVNKRGVTLWTDHIVSPFSECGFCPHKEPKRY